MTPFLYERTPFSAVVPEPREDGVHRAEFLTVHANERRSSGHIDFKLRSWKIPIPTGEFRWRTFLPIAPKHTQNVVILVPTFRGLWFDYSLLLGALLKHGAIVVAIDMVGAGTNTSLIGIDYAGFADAISAMTAQVTLEFDLPVCGFGSSSGAVILLALLSSGVQLSNVVAEGGTLSEDTGLARVFASEASEIQNYYRCNLQSAITAIKSGIISERSNILLTWGERDPIVPMKERDEALRFLQQCPAKVSTFQVGAGSHFLQHGFPMSQQDFDIYTASVVSFLCNGEL